MRERKLTNDDCRAIFLSLEGAEVLARQYGINRSVIGKIRRREVGFSATQDLPAHPLVRPPRWGTWAERLSINHYTRKALSRALLR